MGWLGVGEFYTFYIISTKLNKVYTLFYFTRYTFNNI